MRISPILIVMLLAASCADKEQPAVETPPPDTAGGRPDLSVPSVGSTVSIVVRDTALEVSEDSLQMVGTGQVSFSVQNSGTGTQQFIIDGAELGKWTSTPVAPGQAVLMSMLMQRGTYKLTWPEGPGGKLEREIVVY